MLSGLALTPHGHERTISTRCANIAETSDHGLIAVSLFNGYYSKAKLSDLISWATARFSQFMYQSTMRHMPILWRHLASRQGKQFRKLARKDGS